MQTSQPFILFAPMFQLNYRSSDLASSTTPPLTTGPSTTEGTTSIASQSTSSDTASSDSSVPAADEGGLSTGAVVGIGVGAALGGILLGMLAIWLFFRKRKQKRAAAEAAAAGGAWPETQGGGAEPQVDYKYAAEMLVPNQQIPAEAWSQSPIEIGTQPRPAEMGGMSGHVGSAGPPVELPTGNSRWTYHQSPAQGYQ